jgi:hypothetical protein
MAFLLAVTVILTCIFYLYVAVQFRREQLRARGGRLRPSPRVFHIRKVETDRRGDRRLSA